MLIIFLTLVFLVIDIISKVVVSNLMNVNDSVTVIDSFFSITYVKNTGAAWSMFSGNTWFIIIISIMIIALIVWYIYKNKPKYTMEKVAYSLILGGAFGNFIDRIFYGYVVDFFDFNIFGYNYPVFNIADSFIVIGILLLIICVWRFGDGD